MSGFSSSRAPLSSRAPARDLLVAIFAIPMYIGLGALDAPPLGAQVVPPPAADSARTANAPGDTIPAPPASVDGTRLVASRLSYALTRTTDSVPLALGHRTLDVRDTAYATGRGWAVMERMEGAHLPAGDDSLLLRQFDLAPQRWQSVRGGARLSAEFARDTIYAAIQGPGVRRSVIAGAPAGIVPTAGAMELWLQLLPLQEGWRASLPLLLVDLGGVRVARAELEVEGAATIGGPLGEEWDCWRVVLRAEGAEKRFWVRRSDQLVVRTYQLLPNAGGAALESMLIEPPPEHPPLTAPAPPASPTSP